MTRQMENGMTCPPFLHFSSAAFYKKPWIRALQDIGPGQPDESNHLTPLQPLHEITKSPTWACSLPLQSFPTTARGPGGTTAANIARPPKTFKKWAKVQKDKSARYVVRDARVLAEYAHSSLILLVPAHNTGEGQHKSAAVRTCLAMQCEI